MCVGTFSGVTSAGMVISSALGGTCYRLQIDLAYFELKQQWEDVVALTSSGNSSPTRDMMSDVFPTLAVGGDSIKKKKDANEQIKRKNYRLHGATQMEQYAFHKYSVTLSANLTHNYI